MSKVERDQIAGRAVCEAVRKLVRKPCKYRRGQKTLPKVVAYPEAKGYMEEWWKSLTKKQLCINDIPSKAQLRAVWAAIPQTLVNNYVQSFPSKIQKCEKARGK